MGGWQLNAGRARPHLESTLKHMHHVCSHLCRQQRAAGSQALQASGLGGSRMLGGPLISSKPGGCTLSTFCVWPCANSTPPTPLSTLSALRRLQTFHSAVMCSTRPPHLHSPKSC